MKKLFIVLIDCYRIFISQPLRQVFGGGCRFYPTCSEYAKEAIWKHGAIKGGGMAVRRLLKCHPGSGFQINKV